MDVAAGLFVQHGYAATSLREIAAACGIKAASVYYHFGSKDDLLEAVLRRGIQVMDEAFLAVDASGSDPRAWFADHVRAHLGALFEHGPYTAAHVTTFHTAPPAVRASIVQVRDAYEARWAALLQSLIERGVMSPQPPAAIRRLILLGAMNATIEWFDPDGDVTVDTLAGAITDQFWSGVGASD